MEDNVQSLTILSACISIASCMVIPIPFICEFLHNIVICRVHYNPRAFFAFLFHRLLPHSKNSLIILAFVLSLPCLLLYFHDHLVSRFSLPRGDMSQTQP